MSVSGIANLLQNILLLLWSNTESSSAFSQCQALEFPVNNWYTELGSQFLRAHHKQFMLVTVLMRKYMCSYRGPWSYAHTSQYSASQWLSGVSTGLPPSEPGVRFPKQSGTLPFSVAVRELPYTVTLFDRATEYGSSSHWKLLEMHTF